MFGEIKLMLFVMLPPGAMKLLLLLLFDARGGSWLLRRSFVLLCLNRVDSTSPEGRNKNKIIRNHQHAQSSINATFQTINTKRTFKQQNNIPNSIEHKHQHCRHYSPTALSVRLML
jgi:hypothetical protein